MNRALRLAFAIAAALWLFPVTDGLAAAAKQQSFASPEQAVTALVAAVRANNRDALLRVFGPAGKDLIFSGDAVADRNGRAHFLAAYAAANRIDKAGATATLVIGQDAWPFPIPLERRGKIWRFDTKAGREQILDRRIGRNELAAIEVCRAYVDAQRDYATKDRNGDGILEYAQHFMSSPGQHDGLYWPAASGEEQSPMGELVAKARAAGYEGRRGAEKPEPYQGYYYRILTGQGPSAPGGASEYIVKGHMIGGFALVAFPAKWGDSGIMTFIVNQDGVVYQKNLGADTAALAGRMTLFDPDASWSKP